MDELSPLFNDIEFHLHFRGYDPDEVDAYVDRVAKAASLVQGRLAELQARAEAAEARVDGAGTAETEETLTRTLILAQKTADAAMEEATEEAARLIAEAESEAQLVLREAQASASDEMREADDYASRVLAEAETDRRQIMADAEVAAAAAAGEARDRLRAEVAELEQYRGYLSDDVTILERHLEDQRAAVAESINVLTELVEQPNTFRVPPAPATSGVELAAPVLVEEAAAEASDSAAMIEDDDTSDDADPVEDQRPDVAAGAEPLDELEQQDELEPGEAFEPEAAFEPQATFEPHAALEPEWMPEADIHEAADADATGELIDLTEPEPVTEHEPLVEEVEPVPTAEETLASEQDPEPDAIFDFTADAAADEPGGDDPGDSRPPFGGLSDDVAALEAAFAGASHDGGDRGAPALLITAADIDGELPSDGPEAFAVDPGPATAPMPAIEMTETDADDDPPARAEATSAEDDGDHAAVEASLFADPDPDPNEDRADPFLAQLREAVARDEVELDDDALSAFFDQDDDESGRSWFGRRR